MAKQRCPNCVEGKRPQCCGCAYNPSTKFTANARSGVPPPAEYEIALGRYVYRLHRTMSEWEVRHRVRTARERMERIQGR